MILANDRSSQFGGLLQQVKAIVFFGVPHRGSDLAYWASFATRLVEYGVLGFRGNHSYVSALQKNSQPFKDISSQFIERAAPLNIRTFYETERMGNQLVWSSCVTLCAYSIDDVTDCRQRFGDTEDSKRDSPWNCGFQPSHNVQV